MFRMPIVALSLAAMSLAGATLAGCSDDPAPKAPNKIVLEIKIAKDEALADRFVGDFPFVALSDDDALLAFPDVLSSEPPPDKFVGFLARRAQRKSGAQRKNGATVGYVLVLRVDPELTKIPTFERTFEAQSSRTMSSSAVDGVRVFELRQSTSDGVGIRRLWTRDGMVFVVQGVLGPDVNKIVDGLLSG